MTIELNITANWRNRVPTTASRLVMALLIWACLPTEIMPAHEFRVDTQVINDGQTTPLVRHTTWLAPNRCYTLAESETPANAHSTNENTSRATEDTVTIFDFEQRQVSILDVNSKQKTQLKFEEILEFVAAASARTATLPRLIRFASAPQFKQEWDESQNRLYLNHEQLSYSAKLLSPPFKPVESKQLASQYRTFTDWAARVNTMCPGLPPAARLQLNQAIFAQQAVPIEVRRVTPTADGGVLDIVSRHSYQWSFSLDDKQQMADFDDWEDSFTYVKSEQFFSPAIDARAAKQ